MKKIGIEKYGVCGDALTAASKASKEASVSFVIASSLGNSEKAEKAYQMSKKAAKAWKKVAQCEKLENIEIVSMVPTMPAGFKLRLLLNLEIVEKFKTSGRTLPKRINITNCCISKSCREYDRDVTLVLDCDTTIFMFEEATKNEYRDYTALSGLDLTKYQEKIFRRMITKHLTGINSENCLFVSF